MIINFIKNNLNNQNIKFIQCLKFRTDNCYMGPLNKIKLLVNKFHFELDNILKSNINKKIIAQELLVNIVANNINNQI